MKYKIVFVYEISTTGLTATTWILTNLVQSSLLGIHYSHDGSKYRVNNLTVVMITNQHNLPWSEICFAIRWLWENHVHVLSIMWKGIHCRKQQF